MSLNAQVQSHLRDIVDKACEDQKSGIPGTTVVVVGKDGNELFAHSAGKRGAGSEDPMTLDTIFWIASCTKVVVGLACMQLVEQGILKLDDAEQTEGLCPELKSLKVLLPDGSFEEKKNGITLRMLLSHTAGFGYTFFNERLRQWSYPIGADEFSGRIEDMKMPLLFQPGEGWQYGVGIDWAGIALERATGLTLNEYLQKNIFLPLGIKNMSMIPSHDMRQKLAYMNQRNPDGTLRPRDHPLRAPLVVDLENKAEVARVFNSGGAGIFAKPQDYCKVLAVLLNDGTCPKTGSKLLRKETVDEMFSNQIPQFPNYSRQSIPDAKPDLTNPVPELYPVAGNPPQGWGLTFMLSNGGPTGRSTSTGHWAGLPNLWWWADREKGVAGIIETGPGTWSNLLDPNYTREVMDWDSESANVDLSGSLVDCTSTLFSSMLNEPETSQENVQAEIPDALMPARSVSDLIPPYFPISPNTSMQPPSDLELDPMYQQMWLASQASQTYSSLGSAPSQSPRRPSDSAWMSANQQSSDWPSPQSSLSPFSIDQQMINTSNSHLTSVNLLQIYHDVLEHNLSCWLSDMTCPYQLGSRNTPQLVPELGYSRSNMIYQRTIRLDRVAQSSNLLQLTRAEDQAASKALHLAIMAFATQWAQGSYRHREKYPTRCLDGGEDEIANGVADEFDRILQNHFWEQAQRALQQVAGLESYRVTWAELIFGFTQRPWNPDTRPSRQRMQEQGSEFATESVLTKLHDIIHKDGPPVYMERAARKMHALKFRCDVLEKGLGKPYGSRKKGTHGIEAMSAEERGTIGLLYWMAIMCDTLSSSINERPVVVLDQDCEHERQKEIQQAGNIDKSIGRSRWNLDIFLQGNLKQMRRTHWPCSYEAAAEDVIKSAPVKVLLFRHLSYLQNAVRKSVPEEQIEDIVRMAMLLYEYWNRTHGAFFDELVQNYHAVPQRIRGWFLCISAHWNLAALMFADLLEFIDENSLGVDGATRITGQVARRIRMHSARELSILARVGTPSTRNSDNLCVPQMSDFHHAVKESTLLTEPWTIVLIRAFTKASMVFLGEADESLRYDGIILGQSSHDFEGNMEQAEDCMKGLWLLGKKSDMAREIAEILSLALRELRKSKVAALLPVGLS
ncbi:hypothetical protein DTO027I6_6406 [Penicillium roqueforti]|uniref:uncharacterized protein n=1 Tax=Penicillium roqueforti TaxID=5082 RepID=UPI00190A59F7|nr:uncharacterized protein LCP9604111_5491 [Penicillium roqueforti]KAF9248236.1 hypothetical protein LCP9604111_5491 [Penicillium roqueforti]KAI2676943.1 hypothetical protein LCP963914a_8238 [Penicillium roqueforti]KAI2683116.1 hypothetical protein CBS147355_2256 [Penicillium roqueforti]KAI2722115.1 hypothetical protein CBS147318_2730 [Penicillium roqueforti]KAI3137939.1 hypothetical protein CBS147330_2359 [Penicillium roqueforti]